MSVAAVSLTSCSVPLDLRRESFGELRRSDDVRHDPVAQRARFAEDGYLFVPGFFPRAEITDVRAELLARIEAAGGLRAGTDRESAIPADDVPGDLNRRVVPGNETLRDVVFGERLLGFYVDFFGAPIAHFDHIWTRVVRPGPGTAPHADAVYMNRGTPNVMTAWIPYGDVTREIGGLMMLEKSHLQAARIRNYLESDVDTYCANRGPYKHKSGLLTKNPFTLRERFGGRWLTTDFRMGDLLTFGMTTLHASLDNHSAGFRLSSDTRYQRADEAIDPRWVGPNTEEYAARHRVGKVC